MTRTEVREKHLEDFYWWQDRNPDAAREHAIARQRKHQADTIPRAIRRDMPWTEEEMLAAHQADDVKQFALDYGRTYKSVVQARKRYRAIHNLPARPPKPERVKYNSEEGWE